MDRPIILCGLGRMGRHVLDYLVAASLPVVIIDTKCCDLDDPSLRGARLVTGDCSQAEVLEAAGVADARGVLILTKDDQLNVSTALTVRELNPDVRVVLRMFNQNLLGCLGQAVSNVYALSTSFLTAPLLAVTALTGHALGTYKMDESPGGVCQLVELTVGPASPLCGQDVADAESRHGVQVVAHLPTNGVGRFLLDVKPDETIREGDQLVLHGTRRELAPLLVTGDHEAPELRWGSWLSRTGRTGVRAVREMDLAVLVCALVLILVVAVSTVVLAAHARDSSFTRALLRTVSVMATAAPLASDDFEDSPTLRVFISALRIVGAVLLAAFTAIVTQYLLRAKLRGALEVRRVPEAGHVIVCGLSPVGFRVVSELLRLGERVVVINNNPDGRFVATARQLGAVVMIGDASVVELLRQANAGAARAVVPTTSNDMTNLEVSLLVREMNPKLRVVPLLNEPKFARMLRNAAGVRHAVSEAALAAPAFLAGLYGDRVESVFFVRERLFAVINLVIDEGDVFSGETTLIVSEESRLLPLALVRPGSTPVRPTTGERLRPGDRLLGVIELSDLDSFFRRQVRPVLSA